MQKPRAVYIHEARLYVTTDQCQSRALCTKDLNVLGADVQNVFLTAPNNEKCWMIVGSEFGPDEGKVFLVMKALYGLKSARFSFRAFMAEKLVELGFQSTLADPDVWLQAATKNDGESYYEYVLCMSMMFWQFLVMPNRSSWMFRLPSGLC